jgi:hypothetical protein
MYRETKKNEEFKMKKVINYLELSVLQNEYIALDKMENKTAEILDRIEYLDNFFWDVDQGKILMNDVGYQNA